MWNGNQTVHVTCIYTHTHAHVHVQACVQMIPITETCENAINGRLSHKLHNVLVSLPCLPYTYTCAYTHTHTINVMYTCKYNQLQVHILVDEYIVLWYIHIVSNTLQLQARILLLLLFYSASVGVTRTSVSCYANQWTPDHYNNIIATSV